MNETEAQRHLGTYYEKAFPVQDLFRWLNHSVVPSLDFGNREFAYTLPPDTYVRYQSFSTADAFQRDLAKRSRPLRFEIGCVYSLNPSERKTVGKDGLKPVSKELVFDVDLTDYDEVRTCCTGANVCIKCWQFITVAIDVMERALREDFGYQHILWVFSGRRGVHAWVCDAKARCLDDKQRAAIVKYLSFENGNRERAPLHPHLEASYEMLEKHFNANILVDQDPWRDPESKRVEELQGWLKAIDIKLKWGTQSSVDKWDKIKEIAGNKKQSSPEKKDQIDHTLKLIVLHYMYPRLDTNVSKKLNHLLKSPFCVHPKTDKISVPIDTANHARFDPLNVPTLSEIMTDLDNNRQPSESRLGPSLEVFNRFTSTLLKSEKRTVESLDF